MKLNQETVWYWPGIRRSAQELHALFGVMRDAGFAVEWVGSAYDKGLLPDDAHSDIQQWVNDPQRAVSKWWVGLSLGAVVAHIAACTAPEGRRPKRLTLINPFADRMELSQHLGFSIADQWRLRPIDFHSPGEILVDLIISKFDERIPPDHGHRLKDCYSTGDVTLIELDADHALSQESQQRLLASLLLSKAEKRAGAEKGDILHIGICPRSWGDGSPNLAPPRTPARRGA